MSLWQRTLERIIVGSFFSLLVNISMACVLTGWFRTPFTDESDNTFRDAYPDTASEGTVLSLDKFTVQMVPFVRWRHGGAE
jgi:hypothetical protein